MSPGYKASTTGNMSHCPKTSSPAQAHYTPSPVDLQRHLEQEVCIQGSPNTLPSPQDIALEEAQWFCHSSEKLLSQPSVRPFSMFLSLTYLEYSKNLCFQCPVLIVQNYLCTQYMSHALISFTLEFHA